MPTGPGSLDAQGVWQYGEDDSETLASDMLNLGQASVSAQLVIDRARLTAAEADIDALEAKTTDTGWVTITLTGGATVYSGKTPAYRVKSGICYLRGAITTGTSGTKFTLPVGARPSMEVSSVLREGTGSGNAIARLQENGEGIFAASANPDISGLGPYPVA